MACRYCNEPIKNKRSKVCNKKECRTKRARDLYLNTRTRNALASKECLVCGSDFRGFTPYCCIECEAKDGERNLLEFMRNKKFNKLDLLHIIKNYKTQTDDTTKEHYKILFKNYLKRNNIQYGNNVPLKYALYFMGLGIFNDDLEALADELLISRIVKSSSLDDISNFIATHSIIIRATNYIKKMRRG
jgi:hypothetical protein